MNTVEPVKLCECGCGQPTMIARKTKSSRGEFKGQALRFIHGHNNRGLKGPQASQWRGGITQKRKSDSALRRIARETELLTRLPYSGDGLCKCGCGQKTAISDRTDKQLGLVKGHPRQYIKNHWQISHGGSASQMWKGGKSRRTTHGYITVYAPWHPKAFKSGHVYEHILVVEQAIGRYLVYPERVHHLDHVKSINVLENLHLCKNDFEHKMMHRWERAIAACGHSDWRKCRYCKQWGPSDTMRYNDTRYAHTITGIHRECATIHRRQRRKENMS